MIECSVKDCLGAVGGELLAGRESDTFRGVSIDSRTVKEGQLFFCIRGDRFDGHDFLKEIVKKKAAGIVLSDRSKLPSPADGEKPFVIAVPDTLAALQGLAHFNRTRFPVRVVGVTGTNGKSTTKEMIASIAAMKFTTLKTQGNLNNHIGLPLTLLNLTERHEVAVLEMGMSAAGEIRRLAEIALPDIGLITNISEGHMEHLKTLKSIQAAKGELFEALGARGTAIVNADDPLVLELARSLAARVVTFGINNPADVRADDIRPRKNDGFDFTVRLFDRSVPVRLPFLGYCNIYNALAAVAAVHSLGVPPEDMSAGLGRCQLMAQRYEIIRHDSMTLINDAYNANPRSMREALATLAQFETKGRRFFVIGDMLELGNGAADAHSRLGEEIAKQPVDILVTVGPLAGLAGEAALKKGMSRDQVITTATQGEAVDYLKQNARAGDCLLFKGSRGAKMEQVVQGLTQTETD